MDKQMDKPQVHGFDAVEDATNPIDKARAIMEVKTANGWTDRYTAERLGIEDQSFRHYKRLLRLPEDLQREIETGNLYYRDVDYAFRRGLEWPERIALLRKTVAEELTQRQSKAIARLVANAHDPSERERLIKTPFDAESERLISGVRNRIETLNQMGVYLVAVSRYNLPIFEEKDD